jgi:hypothetical protein
MRAKSLPVSLFLFVLLLHAPVFGQGNLSLEELEEQYNVYSQIANDPDIFWFVSPEDRSGRYMSAQQFEDKMVERIMLMGEATLEVKVAAIMHFVNASQKVKANLRTNLLPNLAVQIKEHTNSPDQYVNVNHLNSLASDSAPSSQNVPGGAASDKNSGAPNGDLNTASNDSYVSCPKTQPGDRSTFKAYPYDQASGGTYRRCVYFGNGYLKLEEPYVNGKLDGLRTTYTWSNENKFSYASDRSNFANGKREGLQESYGLSKNGAVYRRSFTTYLDGMQHGDSAQWYESGQTSKETTFFEGKPILQYNYGKDGTLSYCTEWGSDRKPRNCETGKIRH